MRSFAEAAAAIRNGYPVAVCSGQGFTMTRDRDGFCLPRGSWGHCMCFIGVAVGRRPGLCCLQSWGPNTPDGPIEALLTIPDGQGPWPGVVVVHDAIGYGPDNESTSARIAAAGFVAITPNLYSRGGRARVTSAG